MFKEIPVTKMSLSKRKLVFGVGVNDADYLTMQLTNGKQVKCPFYDRWVGMIKRCYSPIFHKRRPTYKGCSVCDEWLIFSNFKDWMIKQDWQGKHLDKDILVQGNKIYSSKTCLFVSSVVNGLIIDQEKNRGEYPKGVSFHKKSGKYQASCDYHEKQKYLGLYDSPQEASDVYIDFKKKYILEIAASETEPVKSALIAFSGRLT